MKVIQPNCRVQFATEDVDFILSVLGQRIGAMDCLTKLLADEESRDLILDDPALLHALLERNGCLRVSAHFYFYVLVRQMLRRSGIQQRAVADYVAEVLAEFARSESVGNRASGQEQSMNYMFEMMAALRTADDHASFCIRAHMGNYSLFLAGVFPERIRFRAEKKGFPDLSYFESIGQMQYRVASDHRLAKRYNLADIFDTLSERFQETRRALNDMSERLLSLGDPNYQLEDLVGSEGDSSSGVIS